MKKLCVFLMTILATTIMFTTEVEAQNYTFYEAEMIDGMYMTKEKGATHLWQKARYFRRSGDDKAAFCLQPFETFEPGATYSNSSEVDGLTPEQKDRITKIAYYGYGNSDLTHTTNKWYAVAQLMIWRTVEPTGKFYFTDGPDGSQTTKYDNEIADIEYYIRTHNDKPSFDGQTFKLKEGTSIEVKDENEALILYNPLENADMLHINKSRHILTIKGLKEGVYNIKFAKGLDPNHNEQLFFYNHSTSQNLMTSGTIEPIYASIKVIVQKPRINLTKIDADTKSTTPSGEGELTGAEYDLLDHDKKVIRHIVIDKDCKVTIEDLDYGTYYLKETKAGKGYQLDTELHEVILDQDNSTANVKLENKIIKKKVKLHKKFGTEQHNKVEAGIVFDVYNRKGELVTSVTTDENGYAVVELPYGKYTFKQATSTEGYAKVDDFDVYINDNLDYLDLEYDLLDYIIEVPDTGVNEQGSYFIILLLIINGLSYVKKEIYL